MDVRQYPDEAFTTLAHYIDEALLERAFWSLNPRSCPGIDRDRKSCSLGYDGSSGTRRGGVSGIRCLRLRMERR